MTEGVSWSDQPSGNIAQLLATRQRDSGASPFLYVDGDGPWTYEDVAFAAASIANELGQRGVGRGDRVVVRLGNDERFVAAAFATWAIGAVVVPMHPRFPLGDARTIGDLLQPAAVVGDAADELGSERIAPFVAVDRLGRCARKENVLFEVDTTVADGDEALILLTSGTTGTPKGVPLTHGNAWSNLTSTVTAFSSRRGVFQVAGPDKPPNLIANPLSHTAGILRLLLALYVGRRAVLIGKFNVPLVLDLLERHGIDNLAINPSMIRMLLEEAPGKMRLGRVRYVSSGTAPLPPALRERFEARFGVPILQAYGQTEAFGGIAVESVRDVLAGKRRPASVGKALAGVEIRIAGPDGTAGPVDSEGEIQVRSGSMTRRYTGGGDAATLTEDGWLQTGDLGKLDDEGYLYVTGRIKNLIICGGFNVYPEELEARLADDESVRDAAVFGVPDERLGEIPIALVETVDQATTGEDVLARVADRLAPYKRPRGVLVVPEIPRVANGKPDRIRCLQLVGALLKTPPTNQGDSQ